MKHKRIRSFFCLATALAVLTAAFAFPVCALRRFGDVDGDGSISPADARLALRASVELETLTLEQIFAADTDYDAVVTPADARTILRASVDLETLPKTMIDVPDPVSDPDRISADWNVALVTDYGDVTDGGFNQISYEACRVFCKANDFGFDYFKPASDSDEDRIAMIRQAADSGCNVLVLPGFAFGSAIRETAGQYPDVAFIALDMSAGDLGDQYRIPDNVYCAVYREEIAGFMAGYAAVKLGFRQLGFLGGMAVPAVIRYGYGFVQGADKAAAELRLTDVAVKYAYGNQFFGDAEITDAMKAWYAGGTQVVFACGGGIYTSVVDAAKTVPGAKIIGVDVDQAAVIADYAAAEGENAADYLDMTVTSATKGLAPTINTLLTAIVTGKTGDYSGKVVALGIVSDIPERNFVQLAHSTQFSDSFTYEDYAAMTGSLYREELSVSDDITRTAADHASVISVVDFGNIK